MLNLQRKMTSLWSKCYASPQSVLSWEVCDRNALTRIFLAGQGSADAVRVGAVQRPGRAQPLRCLEVIGHFLIKHRASSLRRIASESFLSLSSSDAGSEFAPVYCMMICGGKRLDWFLFRRTGCEVCHRYANSHHELDESDTSALHFAV